MLFASRGCATCSKVLPAFEALAEANPSRSFIVAYPGQSDLTNNGRLRLVEDRADLFDLLQVPVTPYVISIDPDGAIGAAGPAGSEARLKQVLEKMGAQGGRD
jgi:thiol-disulfide isomerase/thioredoxin